MSLIRQLNAEAVEKGPLVLSTECLPEITLSPESHTETLTNCADSIVMKHKALMGRSLHFTVPNFKSLD